MFSDYIENYPNILTPEVVSCLTRIYALNGMHTVYFKKHADCFSALYEITMLQDAEAACKMDRAETTAHHFKALMHGKTPETQIEQEILGYLDALHSMTGSYRELSMSSSTILKYHGILFSHTDTISSGVYRDIRHPVAEDLPKDISNTVIPPRIPQFIDHICIHYSHALSHPELDPLVLIPMFLSDFFRIAPFNKGNIRICLFLIQLLLYSAGIRSCRYVSIPLLIENSKEDFYAALKNNTGPMNRKGKHYIPFTLYLLKIVLEACKRFDTHARRLMETNWSKSEQIRMYIRQNNSEISKAEVLEALPEISQITLERTLHEMLTKGELEKIGGGRYTKYRKI